MALSPSVGWKAGVSRSGAKLRVIVEIDDGTTKWYLQNDVCDNVNYEIALVGVDLEAAKYDPKTHHVQIGRCSLTVMDDWARPIVVANRLKGAKVTALFGAEDTAFTSWAVNDFEYLFTGIVDDINPAPGGTHVVFECLDILAALADVKIKGAWYNLHPLEVIEDILTNANFLGIDSSLYDASSLDPSDARNAANSHLIVDKISTTFDDGTIWEPQSAFRVIGQLAEIVDGGIYPREDGIIEFKLFNAGASAAAHWDASIIKELRQIATDASLINQVVVSIRDLYVGQEGSIFDDATGWNMNNEHKEKVSYKYIQNDTDSQSDYALGAVTQALFTYRIDNPWLARSFGFLWGSGTTPYGQPTAVTAGSTTLLAYMGAGFCGTRGLVTAATGGAAQPADAKPSASRPVYWALVEKYGTPEIVKITSALSTPQGEWIQYWDPKTSPTSSVTVRHYYFVGATVARGQLGTAATTHTIYGAWNGSFVVDITAAVFMASNILDRYSASASAEIEVDVPMTEYAVQVGDLVTIDWSDFLSFGADGINSGTKWEVIKKHPRIYGSPPMITYTLVRASITAQTKSHDVWTDDLKRKTAVETRAVSGGFVQAERWVEGLEVAAGAGLTVTVSAGYTAGPLTETRIWETMTLTILASKDTYVYVDSAKKTIAIIEESLASSRPTVPSSFVPLAKVISGGAGITSVTDYRLESTTTLGASALSTDGMQVAGEYPNGSFSDW